MTKKINILKDGERKEKFFKINVTQKVFKNRFN